MTKAKALVEGDRLLLGGKVWTVMSCRKVGKGQYNLAVSNAFGGTFSKVIEGKREFEVEPPKPLHDAAGAQTRWATNGDVVEEVLGGVELWREAGGVYTVQTVDEASVAAHLLAFHGVTHNGVSISEARVSGARRLGQDKNGNGGWLEPVNERTLTPAEALKRADFQAMSDLHDRLHAEGNLPVPHTHTDLSRKDDSEE